jgi:hypothetical protein
MIGKKGNIYFNLDNVETYEYTNDGKSIILNMVSGRSFMYDVKDVPNLIDYINTFELGSRFYEKTVSILL